MSRTRMRRMRPDALVAAVVSAGLLVPTGPVTASAAAEPDDLGRRLGVQSVPKGSADLRRSPDLVDPNPLLSLLPDPSAVDMYTWKASFAARSAARDAEVERRRAGGGRPDRPPLVVDEEEPDGVRGMNDATTTAQPIAGFGSRRGDTFAADVRGTLAPGPEPVPFDRVAEDNGSIPQAGETGLRSGTLVRTTGAIGDGPHGSTGDGTGDTDFYAVRATTAGQRLVVDIDTDASGLDSLVVVWDAAGVPLTGNDDERPGELDSYLSWTLPASGDYFVSVSDAFSLPVDPFDPGSGPGVSAEGPYAVTLGLDPVTDIDVFAVRLRPGDVLSGSVGGSATRLAVYAPDGDGVREAFGSSLDPSSVYPLASPLTGGGNAVVDHVAEVGGVHHVATEGSSGGYGITLEVYRPGPDRLHARQTIFLDFDGARVDTGIWGGPGVRELSPFSSFVTSWGIPAWQEDALIDRIVATTTENLRRDFPRTGVRVRVLNSRDHADRFGRPDVSRVVVGGTIAESGLPTIGIAQSIDPGNFDLAETAIVLLDMLSASAEEEVSINAFLRPGSDRLRFVGTAIGNLVSHEAGHYLGSWHVDPFDDTADLMDAGGSYAQLFGVGPDGIGGTADDPDVDFGLDTLSPFEGFTGTESTRVRTRWALTG